MAYITNADVAAYLQTTIDGSSTPTSTTVDTWINYAESIINEKSGRNFDSNSETDSYIKTDGQLQVWFDKDKLPLLGVSALSINTGNDFDPTWVSKTEGTDFLIIDTDTGRLKFSNNTSILSLSHGIKTSFTWGFATVPDYVKALTLQLVTREYIKSSLSNTSINTKEKIRVGPIAIENSSGEILKFINQLNKDIDSGFETIKELKSFVYY